MSEGLCYSFCWYVGCNIIPNWWMKAERRMEKVLNGYEMEYSENSPRQSEQSRDEWTKEQGYLLSYVKNSQEALCQPLKNQIRTMQQRKQARKKGKISHFFPVCKCYFIFHCSNGCLYKNKRERTEGIFPTLKQLQNSFFFSLEKDDSTFLIHGI